VVASVLNTSGFRQSPTLFAKIVGPSTWIRQPGQEAAKADPVPGVGPRCRHGQWVPTPDGSGCLGATAVGAGAVERRSTTQHLPPPRMLDVWIASFFINRCMKPWAVLLCTISTRCKTTFVLCNSQAQLRVARDPHQLYIGTEYRVSLVQPHGLAAMHTRLGRRCNLAPRGALPVSQHLGLVRGSVVFNHSGNSRDRCRPSH
jgi:hypothetical protein